MDSQKEQDSTDVSSVVEQTQMPSKVALVDKIRQWRQGWGQQWSKLHTNQVIYVIALVLFFVVDSSENGPNVSLWLIGLLAFFGMARELWAIFVQVWESTLGRLLLLVCYAAIANFTVALAAQKVNMVTGADPTHLFHSQGLATLLMLPLWIMLLSIIAVIVMFGLLQMFKLFTGIFILMRIIGKKTKPKEAFPKTFTLIRLILLAPVTMTMTSSIVWYVDKLNLNDGAFSTSGSDFTWSGGNLSWSPESAEFITELSISGIEQKLTDETLTQEERDALVQLREQLLNPQSIIDDATQADTENLDSTDELVQAVPSETPSEIAQNDSVDGELELSSLEPPIIDEPPTPQNTYILDRLIAAFVYHYEAFEFSHCVKTRDERVVYVTETEILAVVKDESAQNGYRFSARTCEVKTDPQEPSNTASPQ